MPCTAAQQPAGGQGFWGKTHMQAPTPCCSIFITKMTPFPPSFLQSCSGFFPGTWSWWFESTRGVSLVCKNLEQSLLGAKRQLETDHSIKILPVSTLGFYTQHHFPFPFCPSPPLLHLYINTTLNTARFSSPRPGIGSGFARSVLLEADKSLSPYSFRKQINFGMGQKCGSSLGRNDPITSHSVLGQ